MSSDTPQHNTPGTHQYGPKPSNSDVENGFVINQKDMRYAISDGPQWEPRETDKNDRTRLYAAQLAEEGYDSVPEQADDRYVEQLAEHEDATVELIFRYRDKMYELEQVFAPSADEGEHAQARTTQYFDTAEELANAAEGLGLTVESYGTLDDPENTLEPHNLSFEGEYLSADHMGCVTYHDRDERYEQEEPAPASEPATVVAADGGVLKQETAALPRESYDGENVYKVALQDGEVDRFFNMVAPPLLANQDRYTTGAEDGRVVVETDDAAFYVDVPAEEVTYYQQGQATPETHQVLGALKSVVDTFDGLETADDELLTAMFQENSEPAAAD